MPAAYYLFPNVAAVAGYTERGDKRKQPDYQQDVGFGLHIPPLFH